MAKRRKECRCLTMTGSMVAIDGRVKTEHQARLRHVLTALDEAVREFHGYHDGSGTKQPRCPSRRLVIGRVMGRGPWPSVLLFPQDPASGAHSPNSGDALARCGIMLLSGNFMPCAFVHVHVLMPAHTTPTPPHSTCLSRLFLACPSLAIHPKSAALAMSLMPHMRFNRIDCCTVPRCSHTPYQLLGEDHSSPTRVAMRQTPDTRLFTGLAGCHRRLPPLSTMFV